MNCLIIGIPESARVAGFLEAASAGGWPPCPVASWREVLEGGWEPPAGAPRLVRLESPGRNWPTEQRLLELGAGEPDPEDPGTSKAFDTGTGAAPCFDRLSLEQLAAMSEPAGRIVAMRQWYLGWRSALRRLESRLPGAVFLNSPASIAILFDKAACQQRLEAGGCPVPPALGIPASADALMAMMRQAGRRRVFLKTCHGSSASGVVALESSPAHGIQAFSTVELHSLKGRTLIFNRRPGAWTRGWAEVRPLLDAVCRQRALAQVWVPKAGWRGKTMDLRIVTIAGRARHMVVRLSRSPLTNLQLRNVRGDTAAFESERPAWARAARRAAEQAADCFPDCLTLGIDIALTPDGRPWVLEANAFGDHLPGCLYEGLNPWEWQVREGGGGRVISY